MTTITPYPINFKFDPVGVQFFQWDDPVQGRYTIDYGNYIETSTPRNVPEYMISTVMQFYQTPENVLLPMFILLDELPLGATDTYFTVTQREQYRPDLISYQFYDTVNYWWIILLANNILDPFKIEVNTILRIPNRSTVLTRWLQPPLSRVEKTI